jgi:imidazolonepropionase-like amidohydrolase
MRSIKLLFCGLLLLAVYSWYAAAQPSGTTLFEGARLIVGDGSAPMENSAFLVENNRFVKIGRKGWLQAPAGAARVDLKGKTVMPGIVDAHNHLGWAIIKTGEIGKETYSRENLIDHLRRSAYYGIAAVMNFGTDPNDVAFQVRAETIPGAALFRTAGRGMALPNAGPGAEYWKPVAYGVTTEAEARKAVQELAAKKVDFVKIWVDDRNGTVQKLPPSIYRAIIDEAHKHNLRAAAHIFYLEDAKELLRAGIDGFTHGVRDRDVDDEFIQLLKQRPNVFITPNLPDRGATAEDFAFMSETVPAKEVNRIRDAQAKRSPEEVKRGRAFFDLQSRNLAKVNAAGARIALGTDSGTTMGWDAHQELTDMAASGMTPAQVIVAATKTAAEVLKLDQLGTIAAGKSADFIVLDANPLDNIDNTRKIAKVYLRGKELDRAAMRAEWTDAPAKPR